MKKKNLVVLTGAGISAESGIRTFRDSGGLWEGYSVEEVASPEGWKSNYELVLEFYNARRKNVRDAKPNKAHFGLAHLEENYNVTIITQNIDDLHERAGSSRVLHLHGEIFKAQSTINPNLIIDLGDKDIKRGDQCELGSQLRPFIVWFGEAVPKIEEASNLVSKADILVIIGTSMVVYPAAGLLEYAPDKIPIYFIDPKIPSYYSAKKITYIQKNATEGVPFLVKKLMGRS